MSLLKRKPAPPRLDLLGDLRGIAEENLRRQYRDGLRDGVLCCLDQIEGTVDALAPEGTYTGPIPPELKAWIAQAREQARRA